MWVRKEVVLSSGSISDLMYQRSQSLMANTILPCSLINTSSYVKSQSGTAWYWVFITGKEAVFLAVKAGKLELWVPVPAQLDLMSNLGQMTHL